MRSTTRPKSSSDETLAVDCQQAEVLFGRQTQLATENFGPGRRRLADVPTMVRNYAHVKAAAARANAALGVISRAQSDAIEQACREIAVGRFQEQFPTALVIGGGGTTSNMNLNEVIAARASQISGMTIHPNDQVNASQSTNDTYPTAMALTVRELSESPIDALGRLAEAIREKSREFAETTRLGRTCLQDAVTLTVEQTHSSHVTALERAITGLKAAVDELQVVPLGATVLGTGIGAPRGYSDIAVTELSHLTGNKLSVSDDPFDALAHLDPYAGVAQAAARAAITMAKIAADLRLLSSGPRGGLSEVTLPAVQAGSSIMPGKVNPAVPEYVMQLSYRIRGAAHTVETAVASGELELNVMEPVIVDALLDIFDDLNSGARVFALKCVQDLHWSGSRLEQNTQAAFDKWVQLASEQGYDATAEMVNNTSD